METIDLSGVTEDDIERYSLAINKVPDVTAEASEYTLYIKALFDGVVQLSICVWINRQMKDPVRIRIYAPYETHAISYGINDVPKFLKDIPPIEPDVTPIKDGIARVNDMLPLLQKRYEQIIAAFKAQSKEDFYDDASDYQDDDPIDFGDASNYDENLVRRIKEELE